MGKEYNRDTKRKRAQNAHTSVFVGFPGVYIESEQKKEKCIYMRKSALPRSVILTWELLLFIRELKLKNKNIFCLLTIISDSDIIIKLNNSVHTLGCRQVVRQRTLTPLFRGFKSFHPNHNCTEILIQISVQLFYAKRLYSTRFRE